VIIPRILCSVLAHLKVEPDIRKGLNLMKYALNHPHLFRNHLLKGNKTKEEVQFEPID